MPGGREPWRRGVGEFDSHKLIEGLLRHNPQEYAKDLFDYADVADPFITFHSHIGKLLTTIPTIESIGRVKSRNIRGEETENELWRKK